MPNKQHETASTIPADMTGPQVSSPSKIAEGVPWVKLTDGRPFIDHLSHQLVGRC